MRLLCWILDRLWPWYQCNMCLRPTKHRVILLRPDGQYEEYVLCSRCKEVDINIIRQVLHGATTARNVDNTIEL